MIGVKTQGRLGNQLFQYAFAYSTAKRKKTLFFIDYPNCRNYVLNRYFKLRFLDAKRNQLYRIIYNRLLPKKYKKNKLIQHGLEPVESILNKVTAHQYQEGFFQSTAYFKGYEGVIKKLFSIKKAYKQPFLNKYKSLLNGKPLLVIHYRRGDYVDWLPFGLQTPPLLPFSYYEACLKKIENIENYQILWLSDSIAYVKDYFSNTEHNFLYSEDTEINDFQLLMRANKLIISNSSFAWWGAYLNKNNAEVFAPKHWLNFRGQSDIPVGICSPNWHWVAVDKNS